jgi:hypothetical protein
MSIYFPPAEVVIKTASDLCLDQEGPGPIGNYQDEIYRDPVEVSKVISKEDFDKLRGARVRKERLLTDARYFLYFSLRSEDGVDAAMVRAVPRSITEGKHGAYTVRISIVGDNLQDFEPPVMVDAIFDDGYWVNSNKFRAGDLDIPTGYLVKDCGNGGEDDLEGNTPILPSVLTPA